MNRLLAYSPALVLLAAGVVLAAVVPPVTQIMSCCPHPALNQACPQCVGSHTSYPGVLDLLVAWAAALVYTIVVFRIRSRRAEASYDREL